MVCLKKDIVESSGSIIHANTLGSIVSFIQVEKTKQVLYIIDFGSKYIQHTVVESDLHLR